MKFTPKTEEQLQNERFRLLDKGEYGFEIVGSVDEVSKKGNEMIKLTVKLYEGAEAVGQVFDYLLESIGYKLRHAACACGLDAQYNSGNLQAQDFDGRTGRCVVGVQKDKTGQYADRNVVEDYIPRKAAGAVSDDLPF